VARSYTGRTANWSILGNQYAVGRDALGVGGRTRYHTDDSVEYKYYDQPARLISKSAATLTGDLGCENRRRGELLWQRQERTQAELPGFYAVQTGSGLIGIVTRLPLAEARIKQSWPLPGASYRQSTERLAAFGNPPTLLKNPGDPYKAWDVSVTTDYMPSQYFTYRLEYNHRVANVPYFSGPGGVTPPGGNTGAPRIVRFPGGRRIFATAKNRITGAFLVKF